MSDTTAVSGGGTVLPSRPAVPRTVNLAIAAVGAQVVFLVVRVVATFGFTDQLKRLLIKSNNDLKPTDKNFKQHYDFSSPQVAHDLHTLRVNGAWQAVIVAVALLLLAWSLRKVSTATVTRWALVVVMFLTGGPLNVIPASGWPRFIQVSLVLSGVASIVAIVLLFLPESRVYFRAVGDLRRAEFAAKHGATPPPARGSLGGLFRPRPPAPATSRETGVSLDKHAEAAGRPRGAKAKSRTEAEAIARGAQLARERAKASKSRRTEPS